MNHWQVVKKTLRDIYPWPIFIFFIVTLILATPKNIQDANSASRFLTIKSLVEDGTFAINKNQDATNDKITRDGISYSSKPPVLSVIGSGFYYMLHKGFDLSLPEKFSTTEVNNFYTLENNQAVLLSHQYVKLINQENLAVYWLTLILVGGSFLILLLFIYKTIRLLQIPGKYHTLLMMAFGLGTLYLPYSTVLNNHMIAGACLFIGFYYLLKLKINNYGPSLAPRYLSLSGCLTSLAAVIDIPTGLTFLGLFFIYHLINLQNKKQIIYYIASGLPLLIIHLLLNIQITGDIVPAQFHHEYWEDYDAMIENDPIFLYIINILVGSYGLFIYTPLLIFAAWSIAKIIKNKKNLFYKEAWLVFVGFIIITLFFIKIRGYGGTSFGFRWYLAITPLLYFFIILFFKNAISARFKTGFMIILYISIIISIIGLNLPMSIQFASIPVGDELKILKFPLLNHLLTIYEQIK